MTHRYGRHGNKAWLRRRKKRFQHVALTLPPQVAVLHVPLEFLSKIRKVTILMNDGTEMSIQAQAANPLPPSIIEQDTEPRLNGVGPMQSPLEKFYDVAEKKARRQAQKNFQRKCNPYSTEPDLTGASTLIDNLYYPNEQLQAALHWDFDKAEKTFQERLSDKYQEELAHLSSNYGAPTEETRQLLVAARTDKSADRNNSHPYNEDRAIARAFVSLFCNKSPRQEDVNEKLLSDLPERIGLYQKFYAEFEPKKEED